MKKGFTLAEILIALSIVGIIAALTIPPMISRYQKKLYVTALQKEYTKISDAVLRIMDEEKVSDFYESKAGLAQNSECSESTKNCTSGAGYFLNNYFDLNKDKNCSSGACLASSYKNLNDTAYALPTLSYCISTNRGSTICAYTNSNKMRILFDINGKENPNVAGHDLFTLDVNANGSLYNAGTENCDGTSIDNCVEQIINDNWKMEY